MPPKSFKPPRPTAAMTKKSTKPKPTSRTPISKPRNTTKDRGKEKARGSIFKAPARLSGLPSLSPDSNAEEDDPFASDHASNASNPEPVEIDSQPAEEEEEERREGIPADLLTRLLHENFKEEGTRLSKDASKAVGKYMEVFVREALARAAFARGEVEGGDGFLEVEDLEKGCPQLLLDF